MRWFNQTPFADQRKSSTMFLFGENLWLDYCLTVDTFVHSVNDANHLSATRCTYSLIQTSVFSGASVVWPHSEWPLTSGTFSTPALQSLPRLRLWPGLLSKTERLFLAVGWDLMGCLLMQSQANGHRLKFLLSIPFFSRLNPLQNLTAPNAF